MLKGQLIHPDILAALGRCGHGSKILIADGNYPYSTTLGLNASLVNLNLAPGTVDAVTTLKTLLTAIPVEGAAVMETLKEGPYAMTEDPEIWGDYRDCLADIGFTEELEQIERFKFYDVAGENDVALTIATAEQRIYANLLLTIGVVM